MQRPTQKQWSNFVRTGRCGVYEKVYLAKDGRRIPILIGASVIDTPDGKAEVAAFVTELTPLKKAEEALRKANDELERKVTERTAALKLKSPNASAWK